MKATKLVLVSIASSMALMLPAVAQNEAKMATAKEALLHQDYSSAAAVLKELAQAGDPEAQRQLGELYETGKGVPQDDKQAAECYENAAMSQAHSNRADLLLLHGKRIGKTLKLAMPHLTLAAKIGDEEAMNKMGFAYQHGISVKKDPEQAAELYQKAIDKGNIDAMNNLAFLLVKGKTKLGVDYPRALQLFNTAADRGNAHALANLGWLYLHGTGVPESPEKAIVYFRKAAAHGVASARINLGMMYERGVGVQRNVKKSDKLFQLAAESKVIAADNDLEFVHKSGSSAESGHAHPTFFALMEAEKKAAGITAPGSQKEVDTKDSDAVMAKKRG